MLLSAMLASGPPNILVIGRGHAHGSAVLGDLTRQDLHNGLIWQA